MQNYHLYAGDKVRICLSSPNDAAKYLKLEKIGVGGWYEEYICLSDVLLTAADSSADPDGVLRARRVLFIRKAKKNHNWDEIRVEKPICADNFRHSCIRHNLKPIRVKGGFVPLSYIDELCVNEIAEGGRGYFIVPSHMVGAVRKFAKRLELSQPKPNADKSPESQTCFEDEGKSPKPRIGLPSDVSLRMPKTKKEPDCPAGKKMPIEKTA